MFVANLTPMRKVEGLGRRHRGLRYLHVSFLNGKGTPFLIAAKQSS